MKKLFAVLIALHLMIIPIPAHAFIGGPQVRGIAIAAVGVTVAMSCAFKTPSLMLYMAAAAVYAMGELGGGKAQKEKLESENEKLEGMQQNGVRGGDLQLKTLEAQLMDKEKKLETAKKRSKWIGASRALFMAATALAALEILPESIGTLPIAGCASGTGLGPSQAIAAAIVGGYTFLTGGGLMGGMMGAVAGYVVAGDAVKTAMNTAVGRVAAFGVVTALVMMAKGEVDKEVGTLEKDIEKLKAHIAQFRKETDGDGRTNEDTTGGVTSGITSGATSGSTSGDLAGGTGTPITLLPNGQGVAGNTRCLSSSNEITTNCSNPLRIPTPNLRILGNQPELQQVTSQGVEMANNASSGNIGKADIAAASLNSAASKMSDLAKKEIAKANARLKSQGKPLAGTEKEMKDILNSMQSALDKETAKSKTNLAALGLGGFNELDPTKIDTSGQNVTGASSEAVVALPATKGDGSAIAPMETLPDASSTAQTKSIEESAKDALGNNLGDYESNDNDISASKETSLWKQVSNRYLLKYERFFERKKVPAQ